jgi:fluoride exporter
MNMDPYVFLGAALGGGAGSMARAALSDFVARRAQPAWGTLAVNLSGALAIGLAFGLWFGVTPLFAIGRMPDWLVFCTLGVLGGYTTVSTLALQSLDLWQAGARRAALINVVGSTIAGPLLALIGFGLGFVLGDGLR